MTPPITLQQLGWDDGFADDFEQFEYLGMQPARVIIAHNNYFTLLDGEREWLATPAGRLRLNAKRISSLPVVGDWVAMKPRKGEEDRATVHAVLPRRTKFSRRSPERPADEQVISANIDTALIVSDLVTDFNVRRLERYLALAHESGAKPVVLLTKLDLSEDVEEMLEELAPVARDAPVHVISNVTGEGVDLVRQYLGPGQTAVLLGSSGVGKSTLINSLMGRERMNTAETRDDGRGRHTTTHRELVILENGGMIIDNPGMRELGLWDSNAGIRDSFNDIAALAAKCRFSDCSHQSEPGCAVKQAVEEGTLDEERFDNFHKLISERASLDTAREMQARLEKTPGRPQPNRSSRPTMRKKKKS
jgi:ribosome biogenesis GTPase